jgi:hypothetical protein
MKRTRHRRYGPEHTEKPFVLRKNSLHRVFVVEYSLSISTAPGVNEDFCMLLSPGKLEEWYALTIMDRQ